MKTKTHVFKDWEVPLVSLRLQMENNAFLRIIMGNQLQIMEKLKIDTTFPDGILNDLQPDHLKVDLDCVYEDYLKQVEKITGALHDKCWQYAQLRLSVRDAEPGEE